LGYEHVLAVAPLEASGLVDVDTLLPRQVRLLDVPLELVLTCSPPASTVLVSPSVPVAYVETPLWTLSELTASELTESVTLPVCTESELVPSEQDVVVTEPVDCEVQVCAEALREPKLNMQARSNRAARPRRRVLAARECASESGTSPGADSSIKTPRLRVSYTAPRRRLLLSPLPDARRVVS
jgi:hypothetical protein